MLHGFSWKHYMKKLLIEVLIGMAAAAALILVDSGEGVFSSIIGASTHTNVGTVINVSKEFVSP
jgi:hypothetical protein